MSVMDNHTHIYMSPTGDDTKSGSRDEPVRSVTKALQLVCDSRVDDGSGKPDETCICVEAGSYFDPAATITSEHTNGGSVPLVIRTTGDETATFTGAIEVDELLPVPGDIADRLAPSAREHVRMIDLSRFESIGEIVSRGFGRGTSESHPEVFIDDAPASISRWPKEGFVRIAGFPEEGAKDDEHGTNVGDSTYGFYYEDDRLEGWGSLDDVMAHGYWCWDWANTYERIESIDREKKLIKLQPPGSHWGYRKGNRYQFLNIIDEISKPGEYAVDIANRRIYLYPPDTYETIKVSVASDFDAAEAYLDVADMLLFDAKPPAEMANALPGGNAVSFDWTLLAGRNWSLPWMLSGGLDPENVAEAIRVSGASAVDVSSGVENAPGVKDAGRIAAFLAAVKHVR